MQILVQWIAGHRYRAILLAAGLGLTPLFGVLSAGVIVLVTLLKGVTEGLVVTAAAALLLGVLGSVSGVGIGIGIVTGAGLWLPAVGLSHLLRRSQSLSLCLQISLMAAIVLLAFLFIGPGNPTGAWLQVLEEFVSTMERNGMQVETGAPLEAFARIMSGLATAAMVMVLTLSLLLGRWWQSLLVQPGGFAREFRSLRVGLVLAAVAAAVFLGSGLSGGAWFDNVTAVLMVGFLFQGLAVTHAVAALQQLHPGWLVVLYAALVLVSPYAALLLSILGYFDNWFDFRKRFGRA